MRLIGSKLGIYIHLGGKRETQESLENQIRTLGNILGHFPSPTLIPKFCTLFGGPIPLDLFNVLSLNLKHRIMRHKSR